MVTAIANKHATFCLHDKTTVTAVLGSTNIVTEKFQVSALETPLGTVPEALLRASDVISVTVNLKD